MVKEKHRFMEEELSTLRKSGLYNDIRTIESSQGAWIQIKGEKVLNLCSNNYLGLANHPKLIEKAKLILDDFGVGPGAVRTIAGTMTLHKELEQVITDFKEVEGSIALQSGFVANQAVLPALGMDAIFSDSLNHASIIDGIRLTKANKYIYEHNSMSDLEAKLKEGSDHDKKLIVTDGVFSMDGDIAPVDEIVKLADEYNALVMVDDAHGEGVLGNGGRGIADHFGLQDGEVDIEVGTMSKAIGTVGGYIAGSDLLIEFLEQTARPFLFSSALTPPDVAASIAGFNLLMEDDSLVKKLWNNAKYFQNGINDLGFDTGKTQTPITPIMIGKAKDSAKFSKRLLEEKIFATSIGYPTVPKGKARIRAMLSASHSEDDLEFALDKIEMVGKELKLI